MSSLYRGSQTEGRHAFESHVAEFSGPWISRQEVSVPANSGIISAGTVFNAAGDAYAEFAAGDTDLAVMMYNVADSADPQTGVVSLKRNAVVNRSELVWPAAITVAEQDAAIVAMMANGQWLRVVETTPSAAIT